MLNRRSLFKWLAGSVVAAPLVAKAAEDFDTSRMVYKCRELAPPSKYLTSNTAWFLKTEHKDGVKLFNRSHPMQSADFRKIVEPELQKVFCGVYDKHSADWTEVFEPKQMDLFDDRLSADSLEWLEINVGGIRQFLPVFN